MRRWQISPGASNVLIGLGLLLSLLGAVNVWAGTRSITRDDAPFDQSDAESEAEVGFVPYLVSADPLVAPTLPLAGWLGAAQASSPTQRSASATRVGPPPTATVAPIWYPDRIAIPAIELDTRVVGAKLRNILYHEKLYQQWVAPNVFAAGLITSSASLATSGNTVLIGHHNTHGEVFAHLADLKVGDLIWVYAGNKAFAYTIALRLILPERFQSLTARLENARWIEASPDERLTLVTCWPYASNTHRLIIVARPMAVETLEEYEVTPRLTPLPVLDWLAAPVP